MSFHDFAVIFQDYFGHSGSYAIPQELEDRLFHLWKKKSYWDFYKDSIEPVRLSISIQEYKPYFQISRSLISFSNVLLFSVYKTFTCLIKFISRHFNLLDDIISRIAFLISLLDHSLQLHRNKIDFCVLILSPATLVNSFISFSCFLVDSSGSYIYTHTHILIYISIYTEGSFYFLFPICISFLFPVLFVWCSDE